jgi:hypothetical protein
MFNIIYLQLRPIALCVSQSSSSLCVIASIKFPKKRRVSVRGFSPIIHCIPNVCLPIWLVYYRKYWDALVSYGDECEERPARDWRLLTGHSETRGRVIERAVTFDFTSNGRNLNKFEFFDKTVKIFEVWKFHMWIYCLLGNNEKVQQSNKAREKECLREAMKITTEHSYLPHSYVIIMCLFHFFLYIWECFMASLQRSILHKHSTCNLSLSLSCIMTLSQKKSRVSICFVI